MSFAMDFETKKKNSYRNEAESYTFVKPAFDHQGNRSIRHSLDSFFNSQQMIGSSVAGNRMYGSTGLRFSTNYDRFQPKLNVSDPSDTNEKEADTMAEQIMGMPILHSTDLTANGKIENNQRVSRNPSIIGGHETRGDGSASRINDNNNIFTSSGPRTDSSLTSLDGITKGFMESRFGFDFSKVRIHTGQAAERSAQSMDAGAYTIGNDIVFGKGQHAPESSRGRFLLAHELAHVVQHSGKSNKIMRFPSTSKLGSADFFKSIPQPIIFRTSSGISVTLFFGHNSFLLNGPNYNMAEKLSEELRYMADPLIVVDGHTSSEGSEDRNRSLSDLRRTAAIAILKSRLVGTANIQGTAYGETRPAVEEPAENEGEGDSKRALNRRVEITIIPKHAPSTEVPASKPIDLSLPRTFFQPETPEKRLEKMLKEPPPTPIPKQSSSISDIFWKKFDDSIDSVLRDMKVPTKYRGFIKEKARSALEKGAEVVLDKALDQIGVTGKEKEMIKSTLDALSRTKP
jgi:outer membrane protein OmpA-like peptidoglycan-associated protein